MKQTGSMVKKSLGNAERVSRSCGVRVLERLMLLMPVVQRNGGRVSDDISHAEWAWDLFIVEHLEASVQWFLAH